VKYFGGTADAEKNPAANAKTSANLQRELFSVALGNITSYCLPRAKSRKSIQAPRLIYFNDKTKSTASAKLDNTIAAISAFTLT
jgi:hypothetical protein